MAGLRAEQLAGGGALPASWPPGRVTYSPGYDVQTWPMPWRSHDHADGGLFALSWPPSADQLDYAQKAITVALLLLALPAIVTAFVKRPDRVLTGAARKHVA